MQVLQRINDKIGNINFRVPLVVRSWNSNALHSGSFDIVFI